MNSGTIKSYFPSVYEGVTEFDVIADVEQDVFAQTLSDYQVLADNQFVLTCTIEGIARYEKIFGIVANPYTETEYFRRRRILNRLAMDTPYTIQFLRNKLDSIIGVGKWNLSIDYNSYTLTVECSAADQSWFQEIFVTISNVKPANLVFVNKPLSGYFLNASEACSYSTTQYNYRLGTTWALGNAPFWEFIGKGNIKVATTPSLSDQLIQDVASFAASDIASVLINDTLSITTFETKAATNGVVTVEYIVPVGSVASITNVKLKKANGDILATSIVYVPVVEQVVMKHVITVKEGV